MSPRPALTTILLAVAAAAALPAANADPLDAVAGDYVRLVLAVGEHDPAFVDAYYGPPEWRAEARAGTADLPTLAARVRALRDRLAGPPAGADPARAAFLHGQLTAVAARLRMLAGERLAFDEETRLLYGAVSPRRDAAWFEDILADIDHLLPGDDPLPARLARFRARFVVPPERLPAVFDAAIAECRARSLPWLELPEGERFTVEFVHGKPWSGYNWYQGGAYSVIQVNTDLPVYVERAVDLGCHEGYPGHHAYNTLLEHALVRERGWVEFTVYPLFSPQSLIAEGTANYGVRMVFPDDERGRFEQATLFPLAGLEDADADTYYRLLGLMESLSYATNEAARRYLDGDMSREEALAWLQRYRLKTPAEAEQGLRFIETYRGYVINYNLGRDLVAAWVEGRVPEGDAAGRRRAFRSLLIRPVLPRDLAASAATRP